MTDYKQTMSEAPDLDALEATARAATPGPWNYGTPEEGEAMTRAQRAAFLSDALHDGDRAIWTAWVSVGDKTLLPAVTGDGPNASENAAHVAAFDPPTVLWLIGEAREAERLRELQGRKAEHIWDIVYEQVEQAARSEAALARVKARHTRRPWRHLDGMYTGRDSCDACRRPYPCPTIRAIEGEDEA